MSERVIPVYVLAGFLGSGKTTLLRRLIDDAKNRGWKPAVLMNETGDVNLDGMLVDTSVPMAELLGGCICCTIRGDLGLELTNLAREYDPDVIWIESTGVAQPLEIIDAVTDASLYGKLELRGVVTVVDASHLLDRMRIGTGKTFRLMQEQIRAASLVLLNKTDLAAESDLRELRDRMHEWNSLAPIVSTVKTQLDLQLIYETEFTSGTSQTHPNHVGENELEHVHHHDDNQDDNHDDNRPVHGHSHVQVLTHYMKAPVDSRAFERLVKELPDGVYRGKGIVTFRDTANRYMFQFAYRQSDFVAIRPQKTVQDVVVFIGEDFSIPELREKIKKLYSDPV